MPEKLFGKVLKKYFLDCLWLFLPKLLSVNNIAIFASGTGTNAARIIDFFRDHDQVAVSLIVSSRMEVKVVQVAKDNSIECIVLNKLEFRETTHLLDTLRDHNIDFIVLAGFLWLVPAYLIEAYPNRIVNIHPALLPKYGGKGMYGSNVHKAVLEASERESGITIHYVNEKYDEGAIVFQARCDINENDTPETLAARIHELEHEHYPAVIENLLGN